MNPLIFQIAFRYLVSKKSTNAINWITRVAMAGMAFGSMALVLVLSVFNGFEGLVVSLYASFNPDILITPKEGKVFLPDEKMLASIGSIEGVAMFARVLEENAILKYRDHEDIAVIKGVDAAYLNVSGVNQKIIDGKFMLDDGATHYAVMGAGVAGKLGVNLENRMNALQVYLPKRGKESLSLAPEQAFIRKNILPAGVFAIQQEFDGKYVLAPLEFVRGLLEYEEELSSLEVKLKPSADAGAVNRALAATVGENFKVEDRFEQNKFLYRVMRTEKWAVFAILSFILIIASFNIIGALSMLVIEKTKDIAILKTMGASNGMIRQIFLLEGLFTSLAGSLIGVLLAVALCLVQIYYGVIELQGSGTFVIKSYPVEMRAADFILVAITVIVISVATSWIPAQRAAVREALSVQD